MDQSFNLKTIGYVVSPAEGDRDDKDWQDVVARIELLPEHENGLQGLESFSHAFILTYLHMAEYDQDEHLEKHPCNIASMPTVGVFARRAKERPNPIGLTVVKLLRVGKLDLEVRGLDAVDGTPVLDIKPYIPHLDSVAEAIVPLWVDELARHGS